MCPSAPVYESRYKFSDTVGYPLSRLMRVKGCTNNHLQVIRHMLLDAFTKLNNLLYFFTQQIYIFRSSLLLSHVFMECLLLLITVPILLVATNYFFFFPPIYFFGYKNKSVTTFGACSQPH